jgi:hypothetical protein
MSKDRVSPTGPVSGVKPASVSVAYASVASGGIQETVVAVSDAKVGDAVSASPQSTNSARVVAWARVTADGSVGIASANVAAASQVAATIGFDLYLQRR